MKPSRDIIQGIIGEHDISPGNWKFLIDKLMTYLSSCSQCEQHEKIHTVVQTTTIGAQSFLVVLGSFTSPVVAANLASSVRKGVDTRALHKVQAKISVKVHSNTLNRSET